jgi:hypothetical protein
MDAPSGLESLPLCRYLFRSPKIPIEILFLSRFLLFGGYRRDLPTVIRPVICMLGMACGL